MAEKKVNKFFVGTVIIILILLGVVKVILSGMQELESSEVQPNSTVSESVINPGGTVTVADKTKASDATDKNAESSGVAAASLKRGKQVVNQVCAMCHEAGMMGAPKTGNKDDWAPRIKKGMDTLYDHAIHGFKMMPARGGNSNLSDADVKAAVNYLVSLAKK